MYKILTHPHVALNAAM